MRKNIYTKTQLKKAVQKVANIFFALIVFILFGTQVHGQIINTYAGDATANYLGNGGPATAAGLNQSTGVAIDTAGNIYIADSQNYAVRKVDAKTGLITTVAGNGINANSVLMDGIQATASELSDPWGVAVDDSGNIYIADYGDKAIRKVTASTGIISTIAGNGTWAFSGDGGPATAAELSVDIGVALDDSANVYIADQWNHCIRKITKKTGIIKTIAGIPMSEGYSGNGGQATNAKLAYPSGMVVDDSGNVYIADQWNNEIRVVSQKTGIISDFAGTGAGAPGLGSGAYTGDGGPATAAQLNYATGVGKDDYGNIYIADWDNEVIRKVTLKTGIITTVAGDNALGAAYSGDGGQATAAKLNNPSGVVTDACGNIYIADYANNRIRKVTLANDSIKVSPVSPSICGGGSDTLTASGAGSYNWSPSTGLSDSTGSIVIANPTITTTYIITGSGGCAGAIPDTIVVTVTSAPSLTILQQPSQPVCNGQSVIIKISGGGTNFTWSPATGLNFTTGDSVIATPSVTTTYTVTGTSSGGCSSTGTDTVKVDSAPALIVLPQPPPTFCSGQNATLIVSGGGTDFTWSPSTGLSATTGDSVIASPTVSTTYTVMGNDSLGCAASGTESVSVILSPNKPTFHQHGDTLISSSKYDNQWYYNGNMLNGDTSQDLIITTIGNYWVIVANEANGCSTTSDTTKIDTVNGINQIAAISDQLSIYPNPFNSDVIIKINSSAQNVKDWSLQIIDVLGRTVYAQQSLNYTTDIDLSNLSGGVYFITVINKTGRDAVPVVKQ